VGFDRLKDLLDQLMLLQQVTEGQDRFELAMQVGYVYGG
jgi:hypothetical protein